MDSRLRSEKQWKRNFSHWDDEPDYRDMPDERASLDALRSAGRRARRLLSTQRDAAELDQTLKSFDRVLRRYEAARIQTEIAVLEGRQPRAKLKPYVEAELEVQALINATLQPLPQKDDLLVLADFLGKMLFLRVQNRLALYRIDLIEQIQTERLLAAYGPSEDCLSAFRQAVLLDDESLSEEKTVELPPRPLNGESVTEEKTRETFADADAASQQIKVSDSAQTEPAPIPVLVPDAGEEKAPAHTASEIPKAFDQRIKRRVFGEISREEAFQRLFRLRSHLAEAVGVDSFTTLAFLRHERLDIDSNDVRQFCGALKSYMVPLAIVLRRELMDNEGLALDWQFAGMNGALPPGCAVEVMELGYSPYRVPTENGVAADSSTGAEGAAESTEAEVSVVPTPAPGSAAAAAAEKSTAATAAESCEESADTAKPSAERFLADLLDETMGEAGAGFYRALRDKHYIQLDLAVGDPAWIHVLTLPQNGLPLLLGRCPIGARELPLLLKASGEAFACLYGHLSNTLTIMQESVSDLRHLWGECLLYLATASLPSIFKKPAAAERYERLLLMQSANRLCYQAMLFEFEAELYALAVYEKERVERIWARLLRMYFPDIAQDSHWLHMERGAYLDIPQLWHDPLSSVGRLGAMAAGLALWDEARHDRRRALSSYEKLCESGTNDLILSLLENADFPETLTPGAVKRLAYQLAYALGY